MSAPSWPRLAARLLRPQVRTVQGRWRMHEASGTFAHRSPDGWVTLDQQGRLSQGYDVRHTLRPDFQRGDYCIPAGQVTQVQHDGRLAWRVEVVPPPHKRGLLALTVDDASGLLVRQENAEGGYLVELLDLVVDEPVDDEVFAPQAEQDLESARVVARYGLAHRRPVPTPKWFPWRRGYFEAPGLWIVEADRGGGCVGRAPLGQQAPAADWAGPAQVHRLEHRGWSWAVSSQPPMSPQDAQRVVEQVVDYEDR